jgi:transposase
MVTSLQRDLAAKGYHCDVVAPTSIPSPRGKQIEVLAKTQRYEKPVQALTGYKGIKNIFALTMITEIGDVKCFAHLSKLKFRCAIGFPLTRISMTCLPG